MDTYIYLDSLATLKFRECYESDRATRLLFEGKFLEKYAIPCTYSIVYNVGREIYNTLSHKPPKFLYNKANVNIRSKRALFLLKCSNARDNASKVC
jgi:hypothetical protein